MGSKGRTRHTDLLSWSQVGAFSLVSRDSGADEPHRGRENLSYNHVISYSPTQAHKVTHNIDSITVS